MAVVELPGNKKENCPSLLKEYPKDIQTLQSPNTLTFTYSRSIRGFNTVLLSHNLVNGFENENKEADNLAKLRNIGEVF